MKYLLRNKLLSFSLLFLALAPLAAGCGSQMGSHGDLSEQEQSSPGSERPESEQPESEQPESDKPESDKPETEQPGTEQPGSEQSGSEQSGTEQPETEQPETEQPETEQPETEQPETEQPETEQPETEQPGTEQPGSEQSGTEQPETEQPETEQPETENPETENPETEQPETEQPETEQPETEQPETEQPETEQPETEQPGGEESVTPGEGEEGSDGAGEESEKTPKEKVVEDICKELKATCSTDCDKAELEGAVKGSGECLTSLGEGFVECIKDTEANQCSSSTVASYYTCAAGKLSEQCLTEVVKDLFPMTPQDEVAAKICAALNSKCGADVCTDSDSVKEYVHGKGACLTAYGDAFVKEIEGADASQCSKKNMLTSYMTYAWGSLYGTACYDEISAEM